MVESPFYSPCTLTLVLRRICEGAERDARPVIMAIELEELKVADENGEGRLRGPVRGFGTRGSRLHGTSDAWLEKRVV